MGPFTLSRLEMERIFGPTGALGRRRRTNLEVTFMDWWLGSRSDKLLSGWYKGSYVLPKSLCTGNYGANSGKECHLRYTMHLYILKFKVSVRTYFTRCENKKFFIITPKQGQNHEGVKQLNYHQSDRFYFISLKGTFPSFHLYYWESKTFIPLTQIKSVNSIRHLKAKSTEMWLVTSPPLKKSR